MPRAVRTGQMACPGTCGTEGFAEASANWDECMTDSVGAAWRCWLGGVGLTLCNFFKVVAENARLNLIHEIESAFRELVDERAGVVEARVTTAQPLTDAQSKALQASLATRTGKSIRLVAAQDSTLLGGVKVQVGSTVFDASLQGRLRLLKQQLLTA